MTQPERIIARVFKMDEETWRRHANPWSVWTRIASLPVLLLAIWSHAWLGAWALVPVGAVGLWLWLNPRLFPVPARTDTWSAKATFGERVCLDRRNIPIPEHHERVARILIILSALGFATALAGALLNNLLAAVSGGLVAWFSKMWFCDRMVWLYEDMKDRHSPYAAWLRAGKEDAR